jgi:quercetin dioxygenase-like cupin family protein
MNDLKYIDSNTSEWKVISDGVEQLVLRLEPGEGRFLVRFAPGKGYPKHRHPAVEEVFVLEGTYLDMGKEYGAGSYLYYPPNSVHAPISPSGCTIMVISQKKPELLL